MHSTTTQNNGAISENGAQLIQSQETDNTKPDFYKLFNCILQQISAEKLSCKILKETSDVNVQYKILKGLLKNKVLSSKIKSDAQNLLSRLEKKNVIDAKAFEAKENKELSHSDSKKILVQRYEQWRAEAITIITDKKEGYKNYHDVILSDEYYNSPVYKAFFKSEPSTTVTKLLVSVYHSITEAESKSLIALMFKIRNAALRNNRNQMIYNLACDGILLNSDIQVDKEIDRFALPTGKQIRMEEKVIVNLNPAKEPSTLGKNILQYVACGVGFLLPTPNSNSLTICTLAALLKVINFFGAPSEKFNEEEISCEMIIRLFAEMKKAFAFQKDDLNIPFNFMFVFSILINAYSKMPNKTLNDFELAFKEIINSERLKEELNNLYLEDLISSIYTGYKIAITWNEAIESLPTTTPLDSVNMKVIKAGENEVIKGKVGSVYKLIMSFVITRNNFQAEEDKIVSQKAKKRLEYMADLLEEEKKNKTNTRKKSEEGSINTNKAGKPCSKKPSQATAAASNLESTNASFAASASNEVISFTNDMTIVDKYLINIVREVNIMDTINEYIRDIKDGHEIRGKKHNVISLTKDNMLLVIDFTDNKPIIFAFNKERISISERYMAQLASRKIDYTGYGRNGNKIDIGTDGDVREVHIKYHDAEGESRTIASTYKTTLLMGETEVNICYFDRDLSPNEWHVQLNMEVPQHANIPNELESLLSHQQNVGQDTTQIPQNNNTNAAIR